jgi:uncharacterized protein with putative carbohydrate binding module
MPFKMLNEDEATYWDDMSEIDALDWEIFLRALKGTWVENGCLVSAQGTPDGTVAVSSGTYRVEGVDRTCAGGNVSVLSGGANPNGSTASAAHATLPRYDLIIIDSNDQLGVVHGATTAPVHPTYSVNPKYPSFSGNRVCLGVIAVIPASTTIPTGAIVNKDVRAITGAFHDKAHGISDAAHHSGVITDTQHGVRTLASAHALQVLSGAITSGQGLGKPQGLTGAVQATNFVGATTSGAPVSGTFAVGDYIIDRTGKIWVCTVAGSPGTWVAVGASVDPRTTWSDDSDIIGTTGLTTSVNGAGAQISSAAAEASHPGILNLEGGTANSGRAAVGATANQLLLGGGITRILWIIKTPSALSTGTNDYTLRIGLGDSLVGAHTDAVSFRYNHAENTDWVAYCRANSVETTLDTNVAVAVDTWYRLEAVVNAGGTSVEFFIATSGGASSSVGTITTNIPTGAGRELGVVASIIKALGTLNRILLLDYWKVSGELTTAR